VLVGWDSTTAYTEIAADGELLCDVHFGAESAFGFGCISSYRAFQSEWVGRPVIPLDIKMVDGDVYFSWNGATEVVTWELQGRRVWVTEMRVLRQSARFRRRGSKRISSFQRTRTITPIFTLRH
jgi:hypothetical protein